MSQQNTSQSEPAARKLKIFGREFHMPRSRAARITVGVLLTFFGFLGFLPILGFWMVPLGIFILSQEFGWIRRARRRVTIWWGRRKKEPSA